MPHNPTLQDQLRDVRRRRGLSLRAIAGAAGCDYSNLCKLEVAGMLTGSVRVLTGIANALGVRLEYSTAAGWRVIDDGTARIERMPRVASLPIDERRAMREREKVMGTKHFSAGAKEETERRIAALAAVAEK